MNLEFDEVLALVGRLDAAPGFDTPRERFRRFLLERVTDVQVASALINDCQRSVGEQRHRALQDLVVLIGRFLGFEAIFGAYEPASSAGRIDGRWRSRGLLDVLLDLRSDQTPDTTVDRLLRTTAAIGSDGDAGPRIGLVVVSRHYAGRRRLDHSLAIERRHADVGLVSVQSLLALAALAAEERLTHLEIVKLIQSGSDLDLVIDLLDRHPRQETRESSTPEPPPVVATAESPSAPTGVEGPAFWVATLLDGDLGASDLLTSVVGHRHLLGLCRTGSLQSEGSPGDWVCFFLPGRGIAGHAQLASVVDDASSVMRNAGQYSRVYRLEGVELYQEPIVQALRAGRPFAVPDPPVVGPCLSPITKSDFLTLTRYGDDKREDAAASNAADVFSARTSRLPA